MPTRITRIEEFDFDPADICDVLGISPVEHWNMCFMAKVPKFGDGEVVEEVKRVTLKIRRENPEPPIDEEDPPF